MNIEDLLKPRFEVIADYPNSPFFVGEIANEIEYKSINVLNYPHLFKKLEWYEKREISEMPIYIKSNTKVVEPEWEMQEWYGRKYLIAIDTDNDARRYNLEVSYNLKLFVPATEQEYLQFNDKSHCI